MHSERDHALTSRQLVDSILEELRAKIERESFLAPEEAGNWFLCPFIQVIGEPWSELMIITEMLGARPFDGGKQVQVRCGPGILTPPWLPATEEASPPDFETSPPQPC